RDVPGAATGLYGMVDGSTTLTLDGGAIFDLSNDQQFLVNNIDDGCCDRSQLRLTKPPSILEPIPANEAESNFVVAPVAQVNLGKATIRSVFSKHPIKRANAGHRRRILRFTACTPGIKSGEQGCLGPLYSCRMIRAERFVFDRATGFARP